MASPTVRSATRNDAPALATLQEATLAEPQPELLSLGAEGALPCLVAVVDDGPVGYVLAVPDDDEWYVAELAVAADSRRSGVGTRLLEAVCDRAVRTGTGRVSLTARADDDRARAFYDAVGFSVERRLPDHYGPDDDPVDGLLFVRRVD
ncbi:GNAT family N-acetyltransferase [Halomarina ordinaria]|uniref:GNAT family N-acetyltransferase n=1 Tax=Halomarina ordinaria TaxID=3033939 RepID=A0ABD5U4R1_9EURY|nr:GNAT family N-acetyltransferase [Halomarina sp. PSRA2]